MAKPSERLLATYRAHFLPKVTGTGIHGMAFSDRFWGGPWRWEAPSGASKLRSSLKRRPAFCHDIAHDIQCGQVAPVRPRRKVSLRRRELRQPVFRLFRTADRGLSLPLSEPDRFSGPGCAFGSFMFITGRNQAVAFVADESLLTAPDHIEQRGKTANWPRVEDHLGAYTNATVTHLE